MKQPKFLYSTDTFLKRAIPLLTAAALTTQVLLTGCASINRKEETIDSILAKETTLIEKVRLERAQPEVSNGISKDEALKKAEAHLSLALDELLKANEVIQMKLIKQNQVEVQIERSSANDR